MQPNETREPVRVALYVRTSPEGPEHSLEVQVEALQRYARRHGLEALRAYFDIQGGRGQFEKMMAEATGENPPFRKILVHNLSRLPRSADEIQSWRRTLEANGVTIVSVTEPRYGVPWR